MGGKSRNRTPFHSFETCIRRAAGSHCPHLDGLHDAIEEARLKFRAEQPDSFFDRATLDTLGATTGSCHAGMDIAYDGTWGTTRWCSAWPRPAKCYDW